MKKLLIAIACIPLLAACNKDEPVPETTVPAATVPADTAVVTPADTAPPVVAPMETAPATATTPATDTAPATDTTPAAATTTGASGSSVAGMTEGSGGTYVVDKGDTLWSIAEKNGIKHGDLATWNNINDPRELQVGRKLNLSAP